MRGRFITFEGGEGSGKSTHAAMLAHKLRSLGIGVVLTREPGGSAGAEVIRHVLLSGAAKPFGPDAEAILFAAARNDHIRATIEPALMRGNWVVCDRFVDSSRIYQGMVGRADARLLRCLERVTIGNLKPDLTFVLDVPADVGFARAKNRRGDAAADRFEGESFEFYEKLRKAYLLLAASEPDRCVLVQVLEPRPMVAERIWKTVAEQLDPAMAPVSLADVAS